MPPAAFHARRTGAAPPNSVPPMILNRQRRVRVAISPLEEFLERVRKMVRLPEDALTVCLVSDASIARWNESLRGKPGPTDVLSFPANGNGTKSRRKPGSRNAANSSYLGDIAIAPAVARRNARRSGRALENELRILILHGVLHLMGYDHETDHGEMERREHGLRCRLGVPA
jgi:probable rRNA maturation factor